MTLDLRIDRKGINILNEITLSLKEELNADYAFISKVRDDDSEKLQTVAYYGNTLLPNVDYFADVAPCGKVLRSEICVLPKDVQKLFPKDEFFSKENIEGYIGYPLYSLDGSTVIGVFGALYKSNIPAPEEATKKIKLLAPRVELELDRHLLSSKLKDNENLFNAISNQTTEGITVADIDGNYLYVNQAFCKMSGYTSEELLKMTVFDMKAKNQNHQSFYDSKEEYEGMAIRVNLQRKDGSEYLTEIIGDLINVNGQQQVLGTIRDISEKIRAENKIQELNKTLESKVEQRTAELNETITNLNNEISARNKVETELKESLEIKKVLLNEITHRVKNNLQVISSILNIQKNFVQNDESKSICRETSNRIQSMALIHETLYRSREFSRVKFASYIDSLINYLSHIYTVQNIDFITDVEDTVLTINSASCCGMIASELVTNSIKYAFVYPKTTSPTVRVGLKRLEDNRFEFSIVDNGIGLPNDFNVDDTDTLGMQLVGSLVEQLEGSIHIENNEGTSISIIFSDYEREM